MSKATAPHGRDAGFAESIHVCMPSTEKSQGLVKWSILNDQLHGFCSHAPPTSARDPPALQHAGISLQWRARGNLFTFARFVRFSTQCRPFVHCCVLDFVCFIPSSSQINWILAFLTSSGLWNAASATAWVVLFCFLCCWGLSCSENTFIWS